MKQATSDDDVRDNDVRDNDEVPTPPREDEAEWTATPRAFDALACMRLLCSQFAVSVKQATIIGDKAAALEALGACKRLKTWPNLQPDDPSAFFELFEKCSGWAVRVLLCAGKHALLRSILHVLREFHVAEQSLGPILSSTLQTLQTADEADFVKGMGLLAELAELELRGDATQILMGARIRGLRAKALTLEALVARPEAFRAALYTVRFDEIELAGVCARLGTALTNKALLIKFAIAGLRLEPRRSDAPRSVAQVCDELSTLRAVELAWRPLEESDDNWITAARRRANNKFWRRFAARVKSAREEELSLAALAYSLVQKLEAEACVENFEAIVSQVKTVCELWTWWKRVPQWPCGSRACETR